MPTRSPRRCTTPGCDSLVRTGRCASCRQRADRHRGSPSERGYAGPRWRSARTAVLARDPVCVLCHQVPSAVADHWPSSRRALLAAGVADPDAPERLRGLCRRCHARETARREPGGFRLP